MNLEVITKTSSELGEGPLYHEGAFYWVDIIGGKLHCLKNGEETVLYEGNPAPTSVVAGTDGALYLTLEDAFYRLDDNLEKISESLADAISFRFNDGKVDPMGNYWAGTMDKVDEVLKEGSLYALKTDGSVKEMLSGVTVSNGLCWNLEKSVFYYVDSPTKEIRAYDFNPDTLELGDHRTVYKVDSEDVFPDGMCIDIDGNLWLALWNGYAVLNIDADTGELIGKIDIPCKKVTSSCFGGEVFDELYITTASKGMSEEDWIKYPDSGKVFKLKLDTIGFPADRYARDS